MPIAAVLALAAQFGGCATVTRGLTTKVQIQYDPPGAEARTSMGHVCRTPCTLQFNRKDEFVVTITKPGYHIEEIPVVTRVAGAGAAGFAGNVIVGGVVGMAADAATGATLEHFPNPVIATLEPVRKGQQPRVIRREPPPPPTPPVASTEAEPRS
jgi:hypothetical protein